MENHHSQRRVSKERPKLESPTGSLPLVRCAHCVPYSPCNVQHAMGTMQWAPCNMHTLYRHTKREVKHWRTDIVFRRSFSLSLFSFCLFLIQINTYASIKTCRRAVYPVKLKMAVFEQKMDDGVWQFRTDDFFDSVDGCRLFLIKWSLSIHRKSFDLVDRFDFSISRFH